MRDELTRTERRRAKAAWAAPKAKAKGGPLLSVADIEAALLSKRAEKPPAPRRCCCALSCSAAAPSLPLLLYSRCGESLFRAL